MKKQFLIAISVLCCISIAISSCNRKKNEGISPTYGSTGNPNPNNPTVTGNVTPTNPATENTSMYIGGIGWTNPTCGTTNSLALKGFNNGTGSEVTIAFNKGLNTIGTSTYQVAPTVGNNVCSLTIVNAQGQPNGLVWIGKSGSVVVTTTTAGISASFNNVACTQASFNFPTVSASGFLGCNQ